MTDAYPLRWPDGWPRENCQHRNHRFGDKLTLNRAVSRLYDELRLAGANTDSIVVSTNVELRLDGLPRSGRGSPGDAGVAIYFERGGQHLCMAFDRWDTVQANVNSLALTINGMRQMERHGGSHMMQKAFDGFAALPPPVKWWETLQVMRDGCDEHTIKRAFARMLQVAHPDHGGSEEAMTALKDARDRGIAEVRSHA